MINDSPNQLCLNLMKCPAFAAVELETLLPDPLGVLVGAVELFEVGEGESGGGVIKYVAVAYATMAVCALLFWLGTMAANHTITKIIIATTAVTRVMKKIARGLLICQR